MENKETVQKSKEKHPEDINSLAMDLLQDYKLNFKRVFALLIIVLILWAATIVGFVWYLNQYDFVSSIESTAVYNNGNKYCVIVAQAIPAATTINAPVVFTIGTGTAQYPLTKRNCAQVTACGIRTRTRYSVCVSTNATGGVFKMLGNPCCSPDNTLASINGTAPTAPNTPTTGGGGATE